MADETEENATAPDDGAATPADETAAEDEATRAAASSEADAEQPAQEVPASEAGVASDRGAQAPSEPTEALTPKQRRQRGRAAKAAAVPTRPQRSAEERQAERDAERRRKAQIRSARRKREREKASTARDGATREPVAARRGQRPGKQKTRQGVVVSDRASKTIVVRIDVTRRHPFYEKVVRTSATLHAHDEREDAHIGDTVVVRESRPLSRTKRWRLVEVLARAK